LSVDFLDDFFFGDDFFVELFSVLLEDWVSRDGAEALNPKIRKKITFCQLFS